MAYLNSAHSNASGGMQLNVKKKFKGQLQHRCHGNKPNLFQDAFAKHMQCT